MFLTTKSEYGVAAMLELARTPAPGLVQLRTIAGRCRIPLKYLEQILGALAKTGLVVAARGMRGGYRLARDPAEISVWEVIQTLEGRTGAGRRAGWDGSGQAVHGPPGQGQTGPSALAALREQAAREIERVFSLSLAEALRYEEAPDAAMYFI